MFMMMAAMRDEQVLTRLLATDTEVAAAAAGSGTRSTARKMLQGDFKQASEVLGAPAPVPAPVPVVQTPVEPVKPPEPGDEARAFAEEYGVRRNDPCPCGSGRKFKKCCGQKAVSSAG
jgi:uncharacterized protein YecA (UPF0149 family)